ncbi:TPA: DUF4649 family protein [Streptococcus agalactiae]
MIKLYYEDAYDTERCQVFENPNDFIRVLMGCVTVPDNYPITRMTYKDKNIAYSGTYGDLFKTFIEFDWSTLD